MLQLMMRINGIGYYYTSGMMTERVANKVVALYLTPVSNPFH